MSPRLVVRRRPVIVDVDAVDGTDRHTHGAARTQLGDDHDIQSDIEDGPEFRGTASKARIAGDAFRGLDPARCLPPCRRTRPGGDPFRPADPGSRVPSFRHRAPPQIFAPSRRVADRTGSHGNSPLMPKADRRRDGAWDRRRRLHRHRTRARSRTVEDPVRAGDSRRVVSRERPHRAAPRRAGQGGKSDSGWPDPPRAGRDAAFGCRWIARCLAAQPKVLVRGSPTRDRRESLRRN